MEYTFLFSLESVSQEEWDGLDHGDYPFSRHAFLRSLESSHSISGESGWQPRYLVARNQEGLQGAVLLFEKAHSYGEYIFDWAWAAAYERVGLPYYPKGVSMVPLVPATGPRFLLRSGPSVEGLREALLEQVLKYAENENWSSLHFLFCLPSELSFFESHGLLTRLTHQYHWHNRNYADFDAFLQCLKSRKRKQILKERRAVEAVPVQVFTGDGLNASHAEAMDRFYRGTVQKKHAIEYLQPDFFHQVFEQFAEHTVLFLAGEPGDWVAGAVCFRRGKHLYGRHWGCDPEGEGMHFELCYYRPIEYAIAEGVELFEAGAQGEHKVARGFLPALTHSAHWIAHPEFKKSIGHFLLREKEGLIRGLKAFEPQSPYRPVPE
jgi:uncharacterized protein